jgi:hypothetical protein
MISSASITTLHHLSISLYKKFMFPQKAMTIDKKKPTTFKGRGLYLAISR